MGKGEEQGGRWQTQLWSSDTAERTEKTLKARADFSRNREMRGAGRCGVWEQRAEATVGQAGESGLGSALPPKVHSLDVFVYWPLPVALRCSNSPTWGTRMQVTFCQTPEPWARPWAPPAPSSSILLFCRALGKGGSGILWGWGGTAREGVDGKA